MQYSFVAAPAVSELLSFLAIMGIAMLCAGIKTLARRKIRDGNKL